MQAGIYYLRVCYSIYLDEVEKRLKLPDHMFREEGFTERFEWEMNYLFIVSLQMFMLMVCRIFQGTLLASGGNRHPGG